MDTRAYTPYFDEPSVVADACGKTACYKYDIRGRKVAVWGTAGQSPRRLVGGLDKAADGVRRVSLWCSHSPAKQGGGTMGCARSKPRSAFAPQGRAGNGVPASQPTQPVATRPLAIQKDVTWYSAPARLASQGSRSQVCSRLGGWLLKPHPAYGWDLTKNIWEAYTTTGYIGTAYTYSAYGQVTASGSITQPIQWSSEYNDSELALVYYNYRHYNPDDGRWIGRDIKETLGSKNLYKMTAAPGVDIDVLGLLEYWSPSANMPVHAPTEYSKCSGWSCAGYPTRINKDSKCCEYRTKTQDQTKQPKSDGCGSRGLSSLAPNLDFKDACNKHDICYGTCGFDKDDCDIRFLIDMIVICKSRYAGISFTVRHPYMFGFSNPIYAIISNFIIEDISLEDICLSLAAFYFDAVHYGGSVAYEEAQDESCLWKKCVKI